MPGKFPFRSNTPSKPQIQPVSLSAEALQHRPEAPSERAWESLTPPEQNKKNWKAVVRFLTHIKKAALHPDRLWLQLVTWTVVSVVVGIGIGTGIGVMSVNPPLFVAAKLCFIGSAVIFWLKTVQWLATSKATRAERMILAFLIFGISGMVLVEAVRWIRRNQSAHIAASSKLPVAEPSAVQPETKGVSPNSVAPSAQGVFTPSPPPTASAPISAPQQRASLVGRIICLNAETRANTYREIFQGEYPRDFIATINVSVTNDSTFGTTATRFEVNLIWKKQTYQCTEIPIGRWFLKRTSRRPGGGPRRVEWELLKAFPLNAQITNTARQTGWLRFWSGPIQDLRLDDTARLVLVVFDHRNEPHTIYDGPVAESHGCGEIAEGLVKDPEPGWE